MQIDTTSWVSPNYDRGRAITPAGILLHSCEGTRASSLPWLTSQHSGVSCHYYVCRDGDMFQLVMDNRRAWHAGDSNYAGLVDWNTALGIELEHKAGQNYPLAQVAALAWLVKRKIAEYSVPQSRIAAHRWVAVPRGRKGDPTNWSDGDMHAWIGSLYAEHPSPAPHITADSSLLHSSRATIEQCLTYMLSRPHTMYTDRDIATVIVPEYARVCALSELDLLLVIAHMIHETGNLSSFWSGRPQRNPAGLGVNGQARRAEPQPNNGMWRFNPQRRRWEYGLSFDSWVEHAIPAHVGRLLAWALPPGSYTTAQALLVKQALSYRPLPLAARGSAPTLRLLGKAHNPSGYGWASPGSEYGERIAAIANAILGVTP